MILGADQKANLDPRSVESAVKLHPANLDLNALVCVSDWISDNGGGGRIESETLSLDLNALVCVSDWIALVPGNPLKIECLFCEVRLNASLSEVKNHAKTSKHARNAAQRLSSSAVEQGN